MAKYEQVFQDVRSIQAKFPPHQLCEPSHSDKVEGRRLVRLVRGSTIGCSVVEDEEAFGEDGKS